MSGYKTGARRCGRSALSIGMVLAGLALCLLAPAARADVVSMKDGRTFEGEVVGSDKTAIHLDTVVAGIRATLTLNQDEIATHEEKPLPGDFFDPAPPPRAAGAKAADADATLYLEVPVTGSFGKDSFADGLRQALAYAVRYRIGHIVFTIDSDGVSGSGEVRQVYQLLKRYDNQLKYHAVVKKCKGDALAIVVMADTVSALPGAELGGGEFQPPPSKAMRSPEDIQIFRAGLAEKAVAASMAHGRRGDLVRAMIDPKASVYVWRDADGTVHSAQELPEGVSEKQVILSKKPGNSVLTLTWDQLKAMNVPVLDGGVAALGRQLGLEKWTAESDYGIKVMNVTAQNARKKDLAAQQEFERKVKENISGREQVQAELEHNLQLADQMDPNKGKYTARRTFTSGDEVYTTRSWTTASQQDWAQRSDATAGALTTALRCVDLLKQLDEEAVRLGLAPSYNSGKLAGMSAELKTKLDLVTANRNRVGP